MVCAARELLAQSRAAAAAEAAAKATASRPPLTSEQSADNFKVRGTPLPRTLL